MFLCIHLPLGTLLSSRFLLFQVGLELLNVLLCLTGVFLFQLRLLFWWVNQQSILPRLQIALKWVFHRFFCTSWSFFVLWWNYITFLFDSIYSQFWFPFFRLFVATSIFSSSLSFIDTSVFLSVGIAPSLSCTASLVFVHSQTFSAFVVLSKDVPFHVPDEQSSDGSEIPLHCESRSTQWRQRSFCCHLSQSRIHTKLPSDSSNWSNAQVGMTHFFNEWYYDEIDLCPSCPDSIHDGTAEFFMEWSSGIGICVVRGTDDHVTASLHVPVE